jgi:hypothetical protein
MSFEGFPPPQEDQGIQNHKETVPGQVESAQRIIRETEAMLEEIENFDESSETPLLRRKREKAVRAVKMGLAALVITMGANIGGAVAGEAHANVGIRGSSNIELAQNADGHPQVGGGRPTIHFDNLPDKERQPNTSIHGDARGTVKVTPPASYEVPPENIENLSTEILHLERQIDQLKSGTNIGTVGDPQQHIERLEQQLEAKRSLLEKYR